MASIRQSIRSSTASKRPTSAIADGQIALNTASGTPGMFFKDSAGNIIKTGPAHYGASAPNSSPAVGGSTGNSIGEAWLDSSLTPAGWKIWNGSAWVNATPLSSDTVQGLVELATNAETQAGADTARAVTSAGLQSKVSDSISTASSSGIASSSAVKTAYDLANAALPKSGGIITGNLEIGSTGSLTFEGSTADGFETTLAVVDPTLDRTITFPNITGTVVTTGDTGTVTSTMILDGTILNADVNTSAAIAFSKLASLTSARILLGNASNVATATAVTGDVTITNSGVTAIASDVIVNADINSAAAIAYSKLALSSGITNTDVSASAAIVYSKLALSSGITNTDVSASAAIAGTKISPNFGSQNLATTGNITAANHIAASGTAAAPSITISGDLNTGIYSPGADQLAVATNGTGRLFVDSSGKVGIGTSSPSYALHLNSSGTTEIFIGGGGDDSRLYFTDTNRSIRGVSGGDLTFQTVAAERLRITSAGLVGIGTTSPSSPLHVKANSTEGIRIESPDFTGIYGLLTSRRSSGSPLDIAAIQSVGSLTPEISFSRSTNGSTFTESARIDSSGRLLVGTSSARTFFSGGVGDPRIQQDAASFATAGFSLFSSSNGTTESNYLAFGRARGGSLGSSTIVNSDDTLGFISFCGSDGGTNHQAARIDAFVDGTPGANDMPGRLVFSTTADGAASPTERMRITQGGAVVIGNTSAFSIASSTATGSQFGSDGAQVTFVSATIAAYFGRQTNDGTIIDFRRGGTPEGTISVSGTTVSYNGAHLSRWSQLPNGATREKILRGTVLSNIDEMCQWGEEDNEQLNRMKVSDVEGDKNVSGVFQCWDDDDDTYTNDFYCAMTGDFIIRIAEGMTVERGDLLMSAGDGTAKPQDDDIIRSKTIAKVTSTNVSCTYEDGSYCVPCVLMAC